MMCIKDRYSTKELANILGRAVKNILARAQRESWSFEDRAKKLGGPLWIIDSKIPQEVRIAISTAEARKAINEYNNLVNPLNLQKQIAQNALSNTILDNNRRSKALLKADLVRLYLEWQRKYGATIKQKEAFILAYLGGAWSSLLAEFGTKISWKSLERWKKQQATSGTFMALADKRGIARKGHSNLTEKHKIIILGHILNPNAPNVGQCVRQIQKRCIAENIYVPSEATIRRFVKSYSSDCFDEWTLWREGKKAWNDKCAISLLRDWKLVEVGDIVIGDGHTLNFETIDPDTGKAKRMTLLLFYDGASAHPLGWEIMATENTACISSAFRRTCMLLGKYPRVVCLDNGKAFRAKYFKGIADFQQAGFLGLYKDLGCEVVHAWPYHGQSKPIERFFGTFHDMEVSVPSYTGNNIANKPARMMRGEIMHRKLYDKMGGRPLTLEETHAAIATWFCEYASRPQHKTHLQGRTPSEVFNAGRGPGIDAKRLNLLMLQKEIKTISKDGIRHLGRLYWHENLASRRHSVLIRYDEQLSPYTILVYTKSGEFICEAREREHFRIAAGLHPAARVLGTAEHVQDLSEAIELKRKQEKMAGANLRYMLEEVVLPELKNSQKTIVASSLTGNTSSVVITKKDTPLSAERIAEIEAAKEKVRANFDINSENNPNYIPSTLKHFRDEIERYEYLFALAYEQGVELMNHDKIWMTTFEKSQTYLRNCKRRYDSRLELMNFRQQISAS